MWIINTRPSERAASLSHELRQLGFQVTELPLLVLQPLELDEALKQQFMAFLNADMVVVVSPIAVQLGMQYSQELGFSFEQLRQKQWIAVGQSTQNALLDYGLQSLCPAIETSEGMLQLPLLDECKGQVVAFWRGIGGRTLMMDQLQRRDCQIINMLLYRRQLPVYSIQDLTQVFTVLPAIILISSEESWKNWLFLCQRNQTIFERLHNNIYVVLGDRVTQVMQNYFAHHDLEVSIVTVHHLNASMIHQQLQQYRIQ